MPQYDGAIVINVHAGTENAESELKRFRAVAAATGKEIDAVNRKIAALQNSKELRLSNQLARARKEAKATETELDAVGQKVQALEAEVFSRVHKNALAQGMPEEAAIAKAQELTPGIAREAAPELYSQLDSLRHAYDQCEKAVSALTREHEKLDAVQLSEERGAQRALASLQQQKAALEAQQAQELAAVQNKQTAQSANQQLAAEESRLEKEFQQAAAAYEQAVNQETANARRRADEMIAQNERVEGSEAAAAQKQAFGEVLRSSAAAPALEDIGTAGQRVLSVFNGFGDAIRSGLGLLPGLANQAAGAFTAFGRRISGAVKGLLGGNKALGYFNGRMKRIVTGALLFNAISAAIRTMVQNLTNAMAQNDAYRQSMANLKGAAAVTSSALASALAPALSAVANAAATVLNYLNRIIAFFTGKNLSAIKSSSKALGGYAKQAKEAQRSLAGFDEIQRLEKPEQDASGGTGADDIAPNYDFNGYSPFLEQVKAAIEAGDWEGAGRLFAEKVNSILDGFDAKAFGNRIGTIIQHGIDMLSEFIRNTDWNLLGQRIAECLNSLGEKIDPRDLATILSAKITIAIRIIGTALEHLNWEELAEGFSVFAVSYMKNLADAIASVDWRIVGEGIRTFFANVDWAALSMALGNLLGEMAKSGFDYFIGLMGETLAGVKETFMNEWNAVMGDPDNYRWVGEQIIVGLFNGIAEVLLDVGAWIMENVFDPICKGICDAFGIHSPSTVAQEWGGYIMEGMLNGILSTWQGVQALLTTICQHFTQAWNTVRTSTLEVFDSVARAVENIWSGITGTVRGAINSILGLINRLLAGTADMFNGMANILNSFRIRVPDLVPYIGGQTFGFNIPHISAPQIPYLAKGAVIPANREFLAVLGDQSHGTNVEAPLAVIEQAVANVMDDQLSAMMAGFEAVVKAIENKDTSVYIGDTAIGKAAARYQKRQAIVMGGYY